jgi:4-amino-4-deoxy-L-arabinose transferase-like glycosyltransferase
VSAAAPGSVRARWLLAALAVALAVRLATLGTYPLADTSEARYGEIARVMRESGNWVTPQEVAGTPFWAKPPLYAWLSAASTYVFGIDEFALRLPSLLCGFGVLALCWVWTRALAAPDRASPAQRERAGGEGDDVAPALACLILATTVLFFIGYGAVMTDPALGLATAWMTVALQRAVIGGSARALWRYGFFVAAGLAMLAKGPVAFLYVALPVAAWAFWRRRWTALWRALPWTAGIALAAAISVPWYVWAEARTPGFLNYFLVGEHLMRYLQPGWSGDRYGTAHSEPIGTIWAYLAGALGLWTLPLLALARPARGWAARARAWCDDDGRLLALLAALLPLVVFTFARNLIWTYAMPSLPPLAALLGVELARRSAQPGPWRSAVTALAGASVVLVCLGAIVWAPKRAEGSSFATPVAAWRERARQQPGALLYWGRRTPASLRFYSRGAARPAPDLAPPLQALAPGARVYVAIVPEQMPQLQALLSSPGMPPLVPALVGQVKHALIVELARPQPATPDRAARGADS